MEKNGKMNSKQYWNYRFENDWDSRNGKEQTKFFANLIINNLPNLIKKTLDDGVTICDVGCAKGQAVQEYSLMFPKSKVVGIDFSEHAIKIAKKLYTDKDFFCLDIQKNNFKNDILISSNTLEHFKNPYPILDRLLENTNKHLLLLLPFQENEQNMAKEHHFRFDYESFPLVNGDFVLSYHRVIDCSKMSRGKFWNGKQILVIYSRLSELEDKSLNNITCDDDINKSISNNHSKNAKVFVGAPVRNREWILPRYIEGLLKQNVHIETCFIVNDSQDDSEQILRASGFDIVNCDLNSRFGHHRGEYSKENLAFLRNVLLQEFLKSDCDYLFSVDTDIILPEGSLQQLIDLDKDIVSMLIKNSDVLNAHNIFINGKHVDEVPEGLIPVDMTGAVYLIRRSVIESGVRYAYHELGEDIPFCSTAREKGFEIYCDTRLKPIHVFKKDLELIASTKKTVIYINSVTDIKNQIFDILETCQEVIDILILSFSEGNINSALNLLQDLINAFNQIGVVLEPLLNKKPNKVLEEDFYNIDNTIGLIIKNLEKDDVKSAVDVIKNDLNKTIIKWKIDLTDFL